jgi:hypothetical protein
VLAVGPFGNIGDHAGWFNEAARAYAAACDTPPPVDSDANPLPIFRPGLAVACTGPSSGWQIGVSLSLAYICLASGIGPWTTRARPPSAVSNSFCFVSALARYSSLPVRAPCSGKSRRVVAAAASVTIWATDVSP